MVTGTKAGTTATADVTTAGNFTIVSALEAGEISSVKVVDKTAASIAKAGANLSTTAAAFGTGDSVTIGGVITTATAETPIAAKDVYDAVNALEVGDTVVVGSGTDQVTYTIVDEADVDEEAFRLTKDVILAKIHDGDSVSTDGGTTT